MVKYDLQSKADKRRLAEAVVWGGAVGDAFGAGYEFRIHRGDPIDLSHMAGVKFRVRPHEWMEFPAGLWTDDTSMTIALIDSLSANNGSVDAADEADRWKAWLERGEYSSVDGMAVGTGSTTRKALLEYGHGVDSIDANGNGSLMRTSPLALVGARDADVMLSSGVTHAHKVSKIACVIWCWFLRRLAAGSSPREAWEETIDSFDGPVLEVVSSRLHEIWRLPEHEVNSTGYVVDTLEACAWLVTNEERFDCYRAVVEGTVRLAGDTDTIAKIAGEAAAIAYGPEDVPSTWRGETAKPELLEKAVDQLAALIPDSLQ